MWNVGEPASAKNLLEAGGFDWKVQTMQTQLKRLEKKGWVICNRSCRPCLYSPAITIDMARSERLNHVISTLFEGSFESFFRGVLAGKEFDDTTKELLKQLIDEVPHPQD